MPSRSVASDTSSSSSGIASLDEEEATSCKKRVKSVLIIGNGPSAIALSYMLSGKAPYYLGGASDEYLDKRLSFRPDEPIVTQDLEELATGCEGRSNNPVSVFFDMLNNPDADTGLEKPSLLEWKHRPDLEVDHVAIGKGNPGGCWDTLEGNVQTVSLGNWMELPNLKLNDVECRGKCKGGNRVNVAHVALYYQEYVRRMGLAEHFVNDSVVTSVKELKDISCPTLKKQEVDKAGHVHSAPNSGKTRARRHSSGASSTEENAIFRNDLAMCGGAADSCAGGATSLLGPPVVDQRDASSVSGDEDLDSAVSTGSACSSVISQPGELVPIPSSTTQPVAAPRVRRSSLGMIIHSRSYFCHEYGNTMHFDESSARDEQLEELAREVACSAAWDAIVNPQLFCPSLGGCSVGGAAGAATSIRNRTSSWSFNNCGSSVGGSSCRAAPSVTMKQCPVSECFPGSDRLFEVRGFTDTGDVDEDGNAVTRDFKYLAKNVVLATGSFDRPNRVELPGEDFPFVLHSLAELEDRLEDAPESFVDPVVVVGAGLSAADAIVMLRSSGIKMRHAFRRGVDDPTLIFRMLPKALYPEYHEVFNLMKSSVSDPNYGPLPEHSLQEILPDREVLLASPSSSHRLRVSYLAILIGSSPDLSFLEPKLRSELGVVKGRAVERNNPVDIDVHTNEAVDVPGVYAMGPLVGDNFVRFLQGGALAIAGDVLRKEDKRGADKKIQ